MTPSMEAAVARLVELEKKYREVKGLPPEIAVSLITDDKGYVRFTHDQAAFAMWRESARKEVAKRLLGVMLDNLHVTQTQVCHTRGDGNHRPATLAFFSKDGTRLEISFLPTFTVDMDIKELYAAAKLLVGS